MNTDFIKGVVVPIITVIDKDEKIDEAGMRRQVEYVIQGGLQGILAFGSNGEFYQLEEDEMERGCNGCQQGTYPSGQNGCRERRFLRIRSAAHVLKTVTG